MQRLSYCKGRILLVAFLLALLAAERFSDMEALIDIPFEAKHERSGPITAALVDDAVRQYVRQLNYDRYRNTFEDSIFAVNVVIKPKPVPVVKPKPKPEPVAKPPPPPPKPRPFTADLEGTGIAITPEGKIVMIWDKNNRETHVLKEQEQIYRWKVIEIDDQRVILRHRSGRRYEFVPNRNLEASL